MGIKFCDHPFKSDCHFVALDLRLLGGYPFVEFKDKRCVAFSAYASDPIELNRFAYRRLCKT